MKKLKIIVSVPEFVEDLCIDGVQDVAGELPGETTLGCAARLNILLELLLANGGITSVQVLLLSQMISNDSTKFNTLHSYNINEHSKAALFLLYTLSDF